MFVCSILWRLKLSWFSWPGLFLNLYSYNKFTVTRIEIITSLYVDLIILFNSKTILFFRLPLLYFSETGIQGSHPLDKGN